MAEDKKKKATKKTVAKKATDNEQAQQQGPGFGIEKLYLKDVSVEVPN